jgi:hypothetical protein
MHGSGKDVGKPVPSLQIPRMSLQKPGVGEDEQGKES